MLKHMFAALTALMLSAPSLAAATERPHPAGLDDLIAHYASINGIPARLVHRVIVRESGYNAGVVHLSFYGLMQITYPSARSMGYSGKPEGLLDPAVNLTYAVPYLANAYKAAGGDETGAVRLYASGYYYEAKRKHLLGVMRTAASPSLASNTTP
ncbi:MAG TPA: lytic transglycosylase domain-containing protein [Methylovirgula sp.]|jgi:soluble lytic murein transglycosylase-like protein